ncbi:MAG: glycerol-3-phosphate acyltransferase [Actinobacteria bacterium]|nr:glycerol-3-phosphate acyltransferase [Actinomycetota bacterium]
MGILEILKFTVFIIISYLIGAIPFCYIIGRFLSGKKLTEIGDKNPGSWNLIFNVSRFWGIIGAFLDVAKGYFAYFLVLKFTGSELTAILAGCAAVAGHDYSPYLKFSGGKGIATALGFLLAVNPLTIPAFAAGILTGLFVIRNMLWSIVLGILTSCIFMWIFKDSAVFLILAILLILIMVPKQINRSSNFLTNFKFHKEASVKDLFVPKIR